MTLINDRRSLLVTKVTINIDRDTIINTAVEKAVNKAFSDGKSVIMIAQDKVGAMIKKEGTTINVRPKSGLRLYIPDPLLYTAIRAKVVLVPETVDTTSKLVVKPDKQPVIMPKKQAIKQKKPKRRDEPFLFVSKAVMKMVIVVAILIIMLVLWWTRWGLIFLALAPVLVITNSTVRNKFEELKEWIMK
jgi:ABC-type multidrug transport system fused ATPase/permease subunit